MASPTRYDVVLGGGKNSLRTDTAVLGGIEGFLQSLNMVCIPSGTFLMGHPTLWDAIPEHFVSIESFYMGKYPVTQYLWKAVAQLPKIKDDLDPDPSCFKGDNRPVERVSWHDAVEFCARLSQKIGQLYRLPSEAEWEYACRAGTTTAYYFGETLNDDWNELANCDERHTQTTEVGKYPPNAFGLYDMHGNVWEWCADPWHDNYNGTPTDGRVWNENSSDNGYRRVMRGGSWINYQRNCRSAIRLMNGAVNRSLGGGFRIVCVPEKCVPEKVSLPQISEPKPICDNNDGYFEQWLTDYYD